MISNVTCLLFLSQTDLILCFYTDKTVQLFLLQDTFTCFTIYILVKYSDIHIFHHLFLATSFSSFCHHQEKYLQSKNQCNSIAFLIIKREVYENWTEVKGVWLNEIDKKLHLVKPHLSFSFFFLVSLSFFWCLMYTKH